jgi:hypothetical protein
MAEVFRRRVIALYLERKLIDHSRATSMLSWRHSGFSLHGSIGLYAGDQKAMERLAQYMARPPIALTKVVLEERGGKVLFRTKYNPYFKENLKLFAVTDFIAELTAHIPPKTGTYSGERLPKDDDLFVLLGTIDELNSCLGLLKAAIRHGLEVGFTDAYANDDMLDIVQTNLDRIMSVAATSPVSELAETVSPLPVRRI